MSHKAFFFILATILVTMMMSASAVMAQNATISGATLPYSATLTDLTGQPVADGQYDFIFTLYATEKGNEGLWTETQKGVSVKSGNLNVLLGQSTPLPGELLKLKELWLAISVRGPRDADFTALNPRQNLFETQGTKSLDCPHNHFGDYWGGVSNNVGLEVDNSTGTGDGIRAYSSATSYYYAALYGKNVGTTGYGTGVYGESNQGVGVYAYSSYGDGLEATTASTSKSAIYAHADNGNGVWGISLNKYGVHGGSANNFGVDASGGGDGSAYDLLGDLSLGGNRGEIFAFGSVLDIFSNGYVVIDLDNDNNSYDDFGIYNGTDTQVYSVDEAGNIWATGSKSAMVNTEDYGSRLLYTVESSEVWFEDIGSARLDNGIVTVPFEPVFAQTVDLKVDYHVYLTPLCEDPILVYVTSKTASGFTVKGATLDNQPSSCGFDYRVVAKRLGYEDVRLAPFVKNNNKR